MLCNNCGKEIPDGSVFCPECGASLTDVPQQFNTPVDTPVDTPNDIPIAGGDTVPIDNTRANKKSFPTVLIVLLIIVVALVGSVAAYIYTKRGPETEYRKNMVALYNDINDAWGTGISFVDDTMDKYERIVDYFYQNTYHSYNNIASDSDMGGVLISVLDESKSSGESAGTEFYNTIDDLKSKAAQINKDFEALSDPPKRYQAAYDQLSDVHKDFNAFCNRYLDTDYYEENSYDWCSGAWSYDKSTAQARCASTSALINAIPEPTSLKTLITDITQSAGSDATEANLSTAKSVYNAANTAVVNCKASTGRYPTAAELADSLSKGDLITVESDTAVAIEYDSKGTIKCVWVCSSKSDITGTDKDKSLACYNPASSGNVADSTPFNPSLRCINGKWSAE